MIRAKVEAITGPLSEDKFRQVMDLTTTDIMTNRVAWGKRTRLVYMIEVVRITYELLRRVA